ncbi:MAG: gliding motility-associated ABC transporter ATP-binding subunit GldA [Salibacteraceae bacterium]
MSISVQKVTKLYGEQRALNDVSFDIQPGEIVGFLGPNGAGKSTMMKIITCYLPQSMGKVSVCGFDVGEKSMRVREKVGYLPEHNPLYLEMYVKEYLAFIAGLHGISKPKRKVEEMIALVGLTVEQRKPIRALSKGYRQRVGLAQAMIHDPDVLILDEPTTGLDPNQIEEIRSLIKNLGEQKTVMMSTHIMQEVEAICDRVMIINKGSIVADDSAANLRQMRKQSQTVEVEFDGKIAASELRKIKGVRQVEPLEGQRWLVRADTEGDIRASLFQFAVNSNRSVLTQKVAEQRLEDVFRELPTSE